MILIQTWLAGQTPMLCNRATAEALSGTTRSNTPGEQEDPRDIAAKCVYRLPKTQQIAVPGAAIARMLREAGGSHKAKGSRKSLKYLVPAAVVVMDDLCGLFLANRKTPIVDFEVDSRPVTIPSTKGRIMRHRAKIPEWSFAVTLRVNETILDEIMVRRLLIEGITRAGIGDNRPEKGGSFGVGDVVAWDVVSEPKRPTLAQIHAAGG